jgi:hypothetical protein
MSVLLNTCGAGELDFWQLLAGALVVDRDGTVKIRATISLEACTAVSPLVDCDTKDQDPKELLKQAFSIDSCGNITLNFSSDET